MVEVQIVLTDEIPTEILVGLRQMVQVRARVHPTCLAFARRIERIFVELVDAAIDMNFASRRKRGAAFRKIRRNDTIEHVDAPVNGLEQIERRTDAHQVARLIFRHQRRRQLAEIFALRFRFTDRESADRITVEVHRAQRLGARAPKIFVASALNDSEQRLFGRARGERALRPPMRQMHRARGHGVRDGRRDALIEHHHDVAADGCLDRDALLGRKQDSAAVDVALEASALFGHFAFVPQRENLKAARIGQDRSVPIHEPMDPAEFLENLDARPKH